MLVTKLPRIEHIVSDGGDLREDTAGCISAIEVVAARGVSGKASAGVLRDFFIAAANACDVAAGGLGLLTAADAES
jgi:hypothetical protein